MSGSAPALRHITAVIFDMDGLMVDTEPLQYQAFNEYLSTRFGVVLTEDEFRGMVGLHDLVNWQFIQKRFQIDADVDTLSWERNLVYEALLAEHVHPMPGLHDLVGRLKERELRLAVASSSPMAQIELVVKALRLDDAFAGLASGYEVLNSKPDPAVMLLAALRLDVAPNACLVLEDSSAGVRAAKAAGMTAIAVPNVYTTDQDLSSADAVVGSLCDVNDAVLATLGLALTRPPRSLPSATGP